MKRACVWARVSSPGQDDQSLESQVYRSKELAEQQCYAVEHQLERVWTSTDLRPCPEYQQLLRLVYNRKIDAIFMLNRDRLEAQPEKRVTFLSYCKEHDVKVFVCQGPPFVEGSDGKLLEYVYAMGKESANIRSQLGAKLGLEDRAMGRSRKSGYRQLPPTTTHIYGMTFNGDKYVPDDNYEKARLIFQLWFVKPNIDHLIRELHRRGIPSPRGNHYWSRSGVREVLKNPIHAGRVATLKYERVYPKNRRKAGAGKTSARLKPESEWHYIDDLVEKPIITWEQHKAIRDRLAVNRQNAKRNNQHEDLARGIIECQLCGRTYYAVTPTTGKRKYYCSNRWGKPSYLEHCQAAPLVCDELDSALKIKLRAFMERPEVFIREAEARRHNGSEKGSTEQRIVELEKRYRLNIEQERKMARLLSEEAFEKEKSLLLAQRKWLVKETERQNQKLAEMTKLEVREQTVEALAERLARNLDNATYEDWRYIIEAMGVKVLSFGNGIWDVEVKIPVTENKTGCCTSPC